jgi:YkoY family integral membrane protein
MEDFLAIGLLVFLEGALSIDNALVLAVMARSLPPSQRQKALTYGIWGAVGFRILAIAFLSYLLKWVWVKWVGGAYLLYLAGKHFFGKPEEEAQVKEISAANFWRVVAAVELTDIAFSADSILASIAVSKKMWIVVVGGILGIIAMRFAAKGFITLLERFPRFEQSAYQLVALVGAKLFLEGFRVHVPPVGFWIVAAGLIGLGFRKESHEKATQQVS